VIIKILGVKIVQTVRSDAWCFWWIWSTHGRWNILQ